MDYTELGLLERSCFFPLTFSALRLLYLRYSFIGMHSFKALDALSSVSSEHRDDTFHH